MKQRSYPVEGRVTKDEVYLVHRHSKRVYHYKSSDELFYYSFPCSADLERSCYRIYDSLLDWWSKPDYLLVNRHFEPISHQAFLDAKKAYLARCRRYYDHLRYNRHVSIAKRYSKRYSRGATLFRRPATLNEQKQRDSTSEALRVEGLQRFDKARRKLLPTAWEDVPRGDYLDRSWKRHRRHQWRER